MQTRYNFGDHVTFVGALSLLVLALTATAAHAAPNLAPDEVRVATSIGNFTDTTQIAAAYRRQAPSILRAHHLEVAIGSVYSQSDTEAFVSVGPVWRFPLGSAARFVDFGLSPTLLSGSTFDGQELGGNFHFTSSLAFAMRFGRADQYAVGLRAQHTSNGGLNRTNPGLDMVGLTFSVDLF